MKKHLFTFLVMFFTSISSIVSFPRESFAFPIYNPHLAYINCKSTAGFIGYSDNSSLGFGGRTATEITWAGTKMLVSASTTSGTFTSRVIDNSCIQLTP